MNTLFTLPPVLTDRQTLVYQAVQEHGTITALDAGHELHEAKGCRYCRFGERYQPCQYAETEGRRVLEQLKAKGLLKRDVHHVYRLADPPSAQTDVIPF